MIVCEYIKVNETSWVSWKDIYWLEYETAAFFSACRMPCLAKSGPGLGLRQLPSWPLPYRGGQHRGLQHVHHQPGGVSSPLPVRWCHQSLGWTNWEYSGMSRCVHFSLTWAPSASCSSPAPVWRSAKAASAVQPCPASQTARRQRQHLSLQRLPHPWLQRLLQLYLRLLPLPWLRQLLLVLLLQQPLPPLWPSVMWWMVCSAIPSMRRTWSLRWPICRLWATARHCAKTMQNAGSGATGMRSMGSTGEQEEHESCNILMVSMSGARALSTTTVTRPLITSVGSVTAWRGRVTDVTACTAPRSLTLVSDVWCMTWVVIRRLFRELWRRRGSPAMRGRVLVGEHLRQARERDPARGAHPRPLGLPEPLPEPRWVRVLVSQQPPRGRVLAALPVRPPHQPRVRGGLRGRAPVARHGRLQPGPSTGEWPLNILMFQLNKCYDKTRLFLAEKNVWNTLFFVSEIWVFYRVLLFHHRF